MSVTLLQFKGQTFLSVAVGVVLAAASLPAETLTNLEAVNTNGVSTWNGSLLFTITGVLLCEPSEMLDATPNFLPWDSGVNAFNLGGEWQVFVQAISPGDRGGVECWMGQNYGNLPWEPHDGSDSYSDVAWAAEVQRVSHDPLTGAALHKGDLVVVTARASLFYGGMQNINEEHSTDPTNDFTISLVVPGFGLPAPEVISLASVMSTNIGASGHYDIFDATRATGGELYQGMRVRINGLTLVTTNGWTTNADWSSRFCTATDDEGRQIPVVHPLYDLGAAPTNRFDATGVFIQESGSGTDGTFGYELFLQEVTPSAAPVLAIAMKPVITWPSSLSNYQLQSLDLLSTTNWTATTNIPVLVNGLNTVILDPTAAMKVYRLQRVR